MSENLTIKTVCPPMLTPAQFEEWCILLDIDVQKELHTEKGVIFTVTAKNAKSLYALGVCVAGGAITG